MRNKQLGVTMIGWIILLTPFAIVGYAGVRAAADVPELHEGLSCAGAVWRRDCEPAARVNGASIKAAIDKHFEIDMVDYPTTKDLRSRAMDGMWMVEMDYDDEAPLFSNISLHVHFDKIVKMGGGE